MYFMKFFLFARKNFLWKCPRTIYIFCRKKKKKKEANFSNFFGFYNVSFTIKTDVK